MRLFFLFQTILISLNVFGQNDTLIYYSGSGKTLDSENNATYYEKLVKKSKENYLLTTFQKEDKGWTSIDEEKIKRETDSSFTIRSYSQDNGLDIRVYQKKDGGYYIKNYKGSRLTDEGPSKLIFPLQKFGNWRFYDRQSGKLKGEERYLNNQLITNKYWINDSVFINDVFVNVDKRAEYEGGESVLMNFIANNTHYPDYAFKNNITGKVLIRFIVMKDGTIQGIDYLQKANIFLDLEALRVVNSIPNKWIPAEIENKKVNMLYAIPITFQMK